MRKDLKNFGGFLVALTACLLLVGSTSTAVEPDPVEPPVPLPLKKPILIHTQDTNSPVPLPLQHNSRNQFPVPLPPNPARR